MTVEKSASSNNSSLRFKNIPIAAFWFAAVVVAVTAVGGVGSVAAVVAPVAVIAPVATVAVLRSDSTVAVAAVVELATLLQVPTGSH